jgi:hypothetical protein
MKRTLWMTTVAFVLAALWLRTGVAWAQPTGAANVLQILNVRTLAGDLGDEQRTFNTTNFITIEATLYDPNIACVGALPALLQLLLFNLEGQLLVTFFEAAPGVNIGSFSGAAFNPPMSTRYRLLFVDLDPGVLAAGNYKFVWLVKDCTGVNFIVSDFHVIRVLAP